MKNKNAVPKLICNITGNARVTTREYLDKRLAELNVTEAAYLEYYVCKDAMKKLRAGKTVEQIRAEMGSKAIAPITDKDIAEMKRINGKQKGGAAGPQLSAREQKAIEEAASKAGPTPTPAEVTATDKVLHDSDAVKGNMPVIEVKPAPPAAAVEVKGHAAAHVAGTKAAPKAAHTTK